MALYILLVPLYMESSVVLFWDLTLYSQPLSDVTSVHECDVHKYADDTELSQSAPPDDFRSVQSGIQTCIDDVLTWMNTDELTLNTDKPDEMPVGALYLVLGW